jgi:transposase
MSKDSTPKPKNVDYFQVPRPLWRQIKKVLPKTPKKRGAGRPPADNRAVVNGIWYVLWTGCQWKAVHKDWFGVCSSTLHERFQRWQRQGIFARIMKLMVKFYDKKRTIKWKWQAIDSKSCPAPLGGEQTGKNPTDRAKRGSKIHILVDQRGAPLAVVLTGANEHDKWSADDLIISVVIKRPKTKQHFALIEGTILLMSIRLWSKRAISLTSNTSENVGNLLLKSVLFQAKHVSLLAVGSSSAPWAGWSSGAVCAFAGAKKLRTGWRLSNWPALIF